MQSQLKYWDCIYNIIRKTPYNNEKGVFYESIEKRDWYRNCIRCYSRHIVTFCLWMVGGKSHSSHLFSNRWEHVKLLFFPTLFYCLFLIKRWKQIYPCIIPSVPVGIVTGSLSIPAFFYFYTAILGTHLLVLDILIFIISVFITFFVIYKLTLSCRISGNAGWILLVALGVSFWVK